MYVEEVFCLKCDTREQLGFMKIYFGFNQRKLPDGNNEAQKLK